MILSSPNRMVNKIAGSCGLEKTGDAEILSIDVHRHVLCDSLSPTMIARCVHALKNSIDKVVLVIFLTSREAVQRHQARACKKDCRHRFFLLPIVYDAFGTTSDRSRANMIADSYWSKDQLFSSVMM
jgi:hypothetical protein